jgi:hypothetical protein
MSERFSQFVSKALTDAITGDVFGDPVVATELLDRLLQLSFRSKDPATGSGSMPNSCRSVPTPKPSSRHRHSPYNKNRAGGRRKSSVLHVVHINRTAEFYFRTSGEIPRGIDTRRRISRCKSSRSG